MSTGINWEQKECWDRMCLSWSRHCEFMFEVKSDVWSNAMLTYGNVIWKRIEVSVQESKLSSWFTGRTIVLDWDLLSVVSFWSLEVKQIKWDWLGKLWFWCRTFDFGVNSIFVWNRFRHLWIEIWYLHYGFIVCIDSEGCGLRTKVTDLDINWEGLKIE